MKNSDLFFLFFTLPAVGAILLSVWVFPWVPRLRFYSLIPYAFFGGFAIHLYSNIRSHRLVEGLAESKHVHVSMGINGVVVSITMSLNKALTEFLFREFWPQLGPS